MPNEAATIGANFSNYQGNPNLGGSTLGVARIDSRPIEDLARYTMLYNREEYLQRQRDAEKAAEELAKFTQIDLSTTIPKDAKILQEKYDKVIDFVKQNPGALQYKNRDKWLEYNKLKADLMNDTKFAAIRSLFNQSRQKQIADATSEGEKAFLQKKLQDNIEATDIRTPLDYAQQYDLTLPDLGTNTPLKVFVTKKGDNQIYQAEDDLFNMNQAWRLGAAAELGFDAIDQTTTTGQLKTIAKNENALFKMSDFLNQAIQSAKKTDGTIDESKLTGLPMMDLINAFNKYVDQTKGEVIAGNYKNKLGENLNFGEGLLKVEDYKKINLQDGISPAEISVLSQYAKYAGDKSKLTVIQTNDEIEKMRIRAENWRAQLAQNHEDARAKLAYPSTDPTKDFGNIIYGVSTNEVKPINIGTGAAITGKDLKIVNGAIINKDGSVQTQLSGDFLIPAKGIDNSIVTEFNKYAGTPKIDPATGKVMEGVTATQLKPKDGNYTVRFENGVISGIKTTDPNDETNSTFATVDQFQYLTTLTSQKGVTKYKKPEDISGGNKPPDSSKIKKVTVKGL